MKNHKLPILLLLLFLPQVCWSALQSGQTYFSSFNQGTALALDPTHQKLYYATSTSNNLYVFDLNSAGDPPTVALPAITISNATYGLALDSERGKLYLANSTVGNNALAVISLDSSGNTTTTVNNYNDLSNNAKCLALNPLDHYLYVGMTAPVNGLAVYPLDPGTGLPSGAASTYTTNSQVGALAMDLSRRKLYMGGNGKIQRFDLNASGLPLGSTVDSPAGTSLITTLAVDTVRRKLYAGSDSGSIIYVFDLDANGVLGNLATVNLGGSNFVFSLTLDAARRILYVGSGAYVYWFNLNADGSLPGSPSGSLSNTGAQFTAMALDANKQRLYTAAYTDAQYYSLSDAAMPPLRINGGAANTTSTAVNLEWALPNAQFVRVESNSDLVSFNFPNTSTANSTFDQWLSCGGDTWTNTPSLRADPLIIPAELTSGPGTKTITVWFWESTGASNPTGQMRWEVADINLQETDTATPTPVDTASPTPTFTLTPTPLPSDTYTPTITTTNTPLETPTFTHTPTDSPSKTVTATYTLSLTPTFTKSPTISATYTQTITPTLTPMTPSPSPTPTSTQSETPIHSSTPTPVLSPTPSPTATPTATISATLTPSASYTKTSTVSPTPTRTPTLTQSATVTITPSITLSPTITLTVPPTTTPTPAPVFYLDKNRFNPTVEILQIHLELLPMENANVIIYSLKGRKITSYEESTVAARRVDLTWDGRNRSNETVASGLYYVVLESARRKVVKKVLVIK